MNCLVIGYGSIGSRHARILDELGHAPSIVSSRDLDVPYPCHRTLKQALDADGYDHVVVANRTAEHHDTLAELADLGHRGRVLAEKPLFQHTTPLPEHRFAAAHVGYNLRFHPIIARMRELLVNRELIAIHSHAGSYLPHWRPGTDYTRCYSAIKEQGGGVLRDLSHEIDYLLWFCGGWKRLTAHGGTFGRLDIDSEDTFSIIFEGTRCPLATLTLSYLEHTPRRTIVATCPDLTVTADLIAGTLTWANERHSFTVERDETYRLQHQSVLGDPDTPACTLEEGLGVTKFIDAAEKASRAGRWVTP